MRFVLFLFCGLLSYETLVPKHTKVAERGVGTGATALRAAVRKFLQYVNLPQRWTPTTEGVGYVGVPRTPWLHTYIPPVPIWPTGKHVPTYPPTPVKWQGGRCHGPSSCDLLGIELRLEVSLFYCGCSPPPHHK